MRKIDGFDLMYLEWVPPEFFSMWTETEKAWAAELFDGSEFQTALKRHLEIEVLLKTVKPGTERNELIDEQSMLIYEKTWT